MVAITSLLQKALEIRNAYIKMDQEYSRRMEGVMEKTIYTELKHALQDKVYESFSAYIEVEEQYERAILLLNYYSYLQEELDEKITKLLQREKKTRLNKEKN
jgi:hypothetical protein